MAERVAVIGAGVVGLAAASELIRTGADVRCYDGAGAATAQSKGSTRIFRHAHGDARLVGLALRAREFWRGWEQRSGRRLVGDEGLILSGREISDEWKGAMQAASATVLELTRRECEDLLPISRMPDAPVSFDPGGGATRARRTIEFLTGEIGDRLVTEDVLAIEVTSESATVRTAQDSWECDEVVIAAGIDTGRLAEPLGLDVPTEPCLHSRFTYEIREKHRGTRLACWIDDSGLTGPGWRSYGQPVGTTGRYAVGVSWDGEQHSLDVGAEEVSRQSREVADAYVRTVLPGLIPEPVDEIRCTFPEFTFLNHGDGFMALRGEHVTAFYGNNLFKFAPLLGAVLAESVRSRALPEELTMFAPHHAGNVA